MVRSPLHRHECPQEHRGESEADEDASVAPGDLAGANQAIDQADQPGREGCEPGPGGPGGIRRLGLVHLKPRDRQAPTPTGRFTKKMPLQLIPDVITPPSTGPSATAMAVIPPRSRTPPLAHGHGSSAPAEPETW